MALAQGSRSPLRHRDYRLLLVSAGASRTGDLLYLVALVACVYAQTGSPTWVAAATMGRFVPAVLLSPLAGVLADRCERRSVMIAADVAQLSVMTAMTVVAALSGPAQVMIALAVVAAAASTAFQACASPMLRHVVPEDELVPANAIFSTVDTVTFAAGPAVGGLLLLLGAPAAAFGANAATFAISAVAVTAIRTRARPSARGTGSGVLGELREGVAVLAGDRTIAVLVGALVAGTVVYGAELVVLVLVSTDLLGTGAAGLGWLLAASGLGGLGGAAVAGRFVRSSRPRAAIAVLVLLTGLPLASLALVRSPALALVVLLVEGAAVVALDVLVETALQRRVDPDLMGRVCGLVHSLRAAGTALGTVVAPVVVGGIGLPPALALIGVVPVALVVGGLVLRRGVDGGGASDAGPRPPVQRAVLPPGRLEPCPTGCAPPS